MASEVNNMKSQDSGEAMTDRDKTGLFEFRTGPLRLVQLVFFTIIAASGLVIGGTALVCMDTFVAYNSLRVLTTLEISNFSGSTRTWYEVLVVDTNTGNHVLVSGISRWKWSRSPWTIPSEIAGRISHL
jgi:hypothetical protein